MIVPIGVNFADVVFKRAIVPEDNVPLPFDWMVSTPAFVFEMLRLLLDEKVDTRTLVTDHFFRYDKKATYTGLQESYETSEVPL
jgi:hypothetical protein